jgi:hypothetical protein
MWAEAKELTLPPYQQRPTDETSTTYPAWKLCSFEVLWVALGYAFRLECTRVPNSAERIRRRDGRLERLFWAAQWCQSSIAPSSCRTVNQQPMHYAQRVFAVTAHHSINLERTARAPVVLTRSIELGHGKPMVNISPGLALQTCGRETPGANRLADSLENGAKQGNVCLVQRECCRTKPNMRSRRYSS